MLRVENKTPEQKSPNLKCLAFGYTWFWFVKSYNLGFPLAVYYLSVLLETSFEQNCHTIFVHKFLWFWECCIKGWNVLLFFLQIINLLIFFFKFKYDNAVLLLWAPTPRIRLAIFHENPPKSKIYKIKFFIIVLFFIFFMKCSDNFYDLKMKILFLEPISTDCKGFLAYQIQGNSDRSLQGEKYLYDWPVCFFKHFLPLLTLK